MKTKFILFLGSMMLFTMGCGMINSLLGLNQSSGTVSELWPDVPPLEGATKENLEVPLAFQLMIRAMTRSGVDYIAFTTPKSPDEVKSFYSAEKMQANGWQAVDMEGSQTNQQSCVGNQAGEGNAGALCLFSKKEGDKDTLLAIIVAQDEQSKLTNVFYARIAASDLKITPPAAPQGSLPTFGPALASIQPNQMNIVSTGVRHYVNFMLY